MNVHNMFVDVYARAVINCRLRYFMVCVMLYRLLLIVSYHFMLLVRLHPYSLQTTLVATLTVTPNNAVYTCHYVISHFGIF